MISSRYFGISSKLDSTQTIFSIRSKLFAQESECSRKPEIFFYPALPNNQYAPAGTSEFSQGPRIALPIDANFGHPKIDITFRDGSPARTGVTVPEASVHLDDLFPAGKYEIWRAGQALHMQSVAIAEPMESRPDRHFRFRVPAFNASHQTAALFGCESIQLDKCSSTTFLTEADRTGTFLSRKIAHLRP